MATAKPNRTVDISDMDLGDASPIVVNVTLKGAKYTLHEADEAAVVAYRNCQMASTKINEAGKPTGIDGMAAVEPLLVSHCLRDSRGELVPEGEIMTWLHRHVRPLFDRAKEISELDQTDETVEALEKQLADVTKKLADVKKGQDTLGNGSDATMKPTA